MYFLHNFVLRVLFALGDIHKMLLAQGSMDCVGILLLISRFIWFNKGWQWTPCFSDHSFKNKGFKLFLLSFFFAKTHTCTYRYISLYCSWNKGLSSANNHGHSKLQIRQSISSTSGKNDGGKGRSTPETKFTTEKTERDDLISQLKKEVGYSIKTLLPR